MDSNPAAVPDPLDRALSADRGDDDSLLQDDALLQVGATATTDGDDSMRRAAPRAALNQLGRTPTPAIAAAMWVSWWLVLVATGQRMDLRPVYAGWQNLPVEALQDGVFASLLDLHIQPPLWNLVLGGAVRWSPFGIATSMALVLVASGALMAAAISGALTGLGLGRRTTLAFTAAATMTTQLMVFAFRGIYETPTSALLAAIVWAVIVIERPGRLWITTSVLVTATAMLRTLYHPLWVIAVLVAVAWMLRRQLTRRQLAIGVLVPLMSLGGWAALNGVRHGTFGLSSWSQMNLLRSTWAAVPEDELVALHEEGKISGIGLEGAFRAYRKYEPYIGTCEVAAGHPALSIEVRPTPEQWHDHGVFGSTEAPNFNYECYLRAYDLAGDDFRTLVRERPGDWMTARAWAAYNWNEAPAIVPYAPSRLWKPADVATGIIYLRVPHPPIPSKWDDEWLWLHGYDQTLTIATLWTAGLIALIGEGVRRRRRRSVQDGTPSDRSAPEVSAATNPSPPTMGVDATDVLQPVAAQVSTIDESSSRVNVATRRTMAVAVIALTLAWTAAAGVFVELGEQGRFRTATDPIALSVVAVMSFRWYRDRLRGLRERRAASSTSC